MGRIANYSNTQKYSDKKSFDGKPVEEGKVLPMTPPGSPVNYMLLLSLIHI